VWNVNLESSRPHPLGYAQIAHLASIQIQVALQLAPCAPLAPSRTQGPSRVEVHALNVNLESSRPHSLGYAQIAHLASIQIQVALQLAPCAPLAPSRTQGPSQVEVHALNVNLESSQDRLPRGRVKTVKLAARIVRWARFASGVLRLAL
jgi:hypothetical protein